MKGFPSSLCGGGFYSSKLTPRAANFSANLSARSFSCYARCFSCSARSFSCSAVSAKVAIQSPS
ncbi:hypothetical protein, partial [Cylindrospermopsis raciborskii]|uniref:hypothetical protein n=1 Tax=Cylindrospermopsis raciborskii TaxID=77022 RepID=UPI001F0F38B0